MFTLTDLPKSIFEELQDRYKKGVSDAVSTFDMNEADEDCLTGALGQALAMPREQFFSYKGGNASVKVSHTKLRGRGKGAPEKLYGSDGIFQIEVLDHQGRLLMSKGLPFQSKKNWTHKLTELSKQAAKMELHTPGGIIIDFRATGYTACMADSILASGGSRNNFPMQNLGELLATDFLNCKIGTKGLFFDTKKKAYDNREKDFHIITTEIEL